MYIEKKAMKFAKKSYKIHVFETRQIMSFVGKLHNGAETFMKSHYYGDVLRPLDLFIFRFLVCLWDILMIMYMNVHRKKSNEIRKEIIQNSCI